MTNSAENAIRLADNPNNNFTVDMLWNKGNESLWIKALQKYYDLLSAEAIHLDRQLDELRSHEVDALTTEEFYLFLHDWYFVWKYTQKNRLATTRKQLERYETEGRMEELSAIKKHLFQADPTNIRECLALAMQVRGLGTAGASGLLAILFPEHFGTVDQFVVKSLLTVQGLDEHAVLARMKPDALSIDDGVVLIDIMRKQARRLNARFSSKAWTPRRIDMILWAVGR